MFQPKNHSQATTQVYHGDDTSDRSIIDKTDSEWSPHHNGNNIHKTSEAMIERYDYGRPRYETHVAGGYHAR